jgi:hypothetical protein
MRTKLVIGTIVLIAALVAISIVIYKKNLRKEVLALYGEEIDLTGKGVKDLREMIRVYNTKQTEGHDGK